MPFYKGQSVKHDTTGITGEVDGRGHYPDTVVIKIEAAKIGEKPRRMEVYLKHLTATNNSELRGAC